MLTLNEQELLRIIKTLVENCPEVGQIYDQQHAHTQMRAILMIQDLLDDTHEGGVISTP